MTRLGWVLVLSAVLGACASSATPSPSIGFSFDVEFAGPVGQDQILGQGGNSHSTEWSCTSGAGGQDLASVELHGTATTLRSLSVATKNGGYEVSATIDATRYLVDVGANGRGVNVYRSLYLGTDDGRNVVVGLSDLTLASANGTSTVKIKTGTIVFASSACTLG